MSNQSKRSIQDILQSYTAAPVHKININLQFYQFSSMIIKQANHSRDQLPFSKSQAKQPHKQSTQIEISLLTGKHIRTNQEIQTDIKVKRILSYQKISFSIRKMNQMFKADIKYLGKSQPSKFQKREQIVSYEKGKRKNRMANKQINKIPEKIKTSSQKLKICLHANKNRPQSYNICTSGQLFHNFNPLKLSEKKNHRVKTSYSEDQSQIHQVQNQLINEECPEERKDICKSSKANKKSIIKVLKDENQQSILINTDGIPGINFKGYDAKKLNNANNKLEGSLNQTKSSFVSKSVSTYIHMGSLLSGHSNQAIDKMFLLRNEQGLEAKPRQWHLYNCLRLNSLQLYQTNLKLSCQNWILIDYKQLKYLRGWNPKQMKEFSISIKLFVSSIMLNLYQNNNFDFDKTKYRINNQLVGNKVQKHILQNADFSLQANTIISLWDLLIGMFVSKNNDIIWHLIYAIGYLYKKYNFYNEVDEQISTEGDQIIHLKNNQQLIKQYQNIFLLQCKQIIERLQINGIALGFRKRKYKLTNDNYKIIRGEKYDHSLFKETNQHQYLSIRATPVQIGILFLDCLSYPKFHQLFLLKLPIQVSIRFQVGNNFWENRIHTWRHDFAQFISNNNQVMMSINNESSSYALIAYNYLLQTVVVCNDCKVNMCKKDLERIHEWMQISFNRFKKSKIHHSICVPKDCQRTN